jgi:uncharacterized hydrophobic protein (TIGR00271 family)
MTSSKRGLLRLFATFRGVVTLRGMVDEPSMIEELRQGADFRGTSLWALVLAIIVASVGLNVNSTAVIIGAMLISPLMGPIMGAGLGIGINDTVLLRRSVRNVAVAALLSIITSALYFSLSPLGEAQSELLARTRPTIYDVLIALAGGCAGVIASTRRVDRGNVLPGVAIATALMPPLCTAGYGLSQGDAGFFFGALYLFLINCVFICLSTLGVVRLLGFERVADLDPKHASRIRLIITAATILTVVPSSYVAWQVVRETRRESAARRYVAENFDFPDRTVINTVVTHGRDSSTIETTLLGRPLSDDVVDELRARLPEYGLATTRLLIRQPSEGEMAPEQLGEMVRSGILEDLYTRNQTALEGRDARIRLLESEIVRLRGREGPLRAASLELGALYPVLRSLQLGTERLVPSGDSVQTAVVTWARLPAATDRARVDAFLRARLGVDSLRVRHLPDRP